MLTKAAFGNQLIHRHKHHISMQDTNLLLFEIYFEGHLHGELNGESVHINSVDIRVIDFSREYLGRSTPTRLVSVLVSHDMIGYDPSIHPAIIKIPGQSAIGRVLRTTILGLFEQLDNTQGQQRERRYQGA